MIIDNKSYTGDGSTRQYATSTIILSNSHIAVFLNNVLQPTNSYDLLGSVVLFKTAPSNGVAINFVVSDTGEDLPVAPNEYNTVYANITKIQNVSSIINQIVNLDAIKNEIVNVDGLSTEIVDLYNNRLAILGVYAINTDITSLNSIKAKLESLYADKTTLDSLYADKATLDSLYADKLVLDTLYAMKTKLDSIYADKLTLDSIYANLNSILSIHQNIDNVNYFADRYLGDRDIEPTTRLDGSSLLNGDLYFDKRIQLMRVYSNDGWKAAYASTDSYTKAEIENLFVRASGNQTVYDVKTFNLPIVGSITGNSGSATKLETARKINGVEFDGSANITVVDDTAVKLTGNQTIDGVKTFSSNPISTAAQSTAVNALTRKDYVDNLVTAVSNTAYQVLNGWYKDTKTGVMIQWGHAAVYGGGTRQTVWLPVAMTNAITAIIVTFGVEIENGSMSVGADPNPTYPNFAFDVKGNGMGSSTGIRYIAIGY